MRLKEYTGTENKFCVSCGISFNAFKSDKRVYCSAKCYHSSPTKGARPRNRVTKLCAYCGNSFERPAGNFKKHVKNHFCSHKCSSVWWSVFGPHGELNKSWLGGYTPKEYRDGWGMAKKAVKERAKDHCEECGGKHKLMDVHHKIPIRLKQPIEITNHPDNLQLLCRPCHMKADRLLRGKHPNQKRVV